MVNEESHIIFRLPFAHEFVNRRLESLEKYGQSIPDHDSFLVTSPFDSLSRLVTFQRVPDWPLIVYIGENLNYSYALIAEFRQKEQKALGLICGNRCPSRPSHFMVNEAPSR
ncbi:MAG: hypothetical protein LRY63_11620 [Nitrincola sp.]|nr:hypothetical protein [Nitrincola sp.]